MNPKSVNKVILKYFVTLSLFSLFFLSASSIASEKIEVKGIRYWSSPDYTRVVVDLSGPFEFSTNRISNPDRIYFDLKNTTIAKEVRKGFPVGDGILREIRAGQFNSDTVRVVLDLEKIADFNAFILDNPVRLVIDVYGTKKMNRPEATIIKRRIVIDPGHGGHDPGAIGPGGLYEKDIVLDIALKLKEILLADPLNEVFLTRETDIFISLEERTAIANNKNADLFVSIHANASPRREAKGIETYLLNWTNDEEAMRVAARENAISLKRMREIHRQMDILETIKSDLLRQNKRDESIKLAHYIQKSMVSTLNNGYEDIVDRGVKQALFFVLFGARMPSILVEVSFISNPEEEGLLSKESYRIQIAKAIAMGLNTYMNSTPTIQKVAGL
ncbi:MAG: N-acetylmuramoyl-L-alanine amidase [Thermodesulfovibrionales bacterium]|nr:N-acetylmuramoyl-L-alanine amidase [Thermodesulfovibrionales bacterium]